MQEMSNEDYSLIFKRIKCIYCKQLIHIDNFAGITKKGMICGKASCLIKLAKEMSKIRKARGKNEQIKRRKEKL